MSIEILLYFVNFRKQKYLKRLLQAVSGVDPIPKALQDLIALKLKFINALSGLAFFSTIDHNKYRAR
ncbi:hypothetical protein D1AOALGA4SA_1242 [Olavius algarvensis Delta 1 endosymbiont]|nr:hypothetical protein D1AOALGA4SA_1242 [Olavius algarvensis Delta 1 endosymbiont]